MSVCGSMLSHKEKAPCEAMFLNLHYFWLFGNSSEYLDLEFLRLVSLFIVWHKHVLMKSIV